MSNIALERVFFLKRAPELHWQFEFLFLSTFIVYGQTHFFLYELPGCYLCSAHYYSLLNLDNTIVKSNCWGFTIIFTLKQKRTERRKIYRESNVWVPVVTWKGFCQEHKITFVSQSCLESIKDIWFSQECSQCFIFNYYDNVASENYSGCTRLSIRRNFGYKNYIPFC